MYDVQFLCDRYGLTVKQARDRLTALTPALTNHLQQGKRGAKLLTDGGLAIFDRLRELERGGLSVSSAIEKIREELSQAENPQSSTSVSPQGVNGEPEVVELLKHQVEDLRSERDRLLSMIEAKDEQLRALMPGPPQGSTPTPTGNGGWERERMSRWEAFRYALLGR